MSDVGVDDVWVAAADVVSGDDHLLCSLRLTVRTVVANAQHECFICDSLKSVDVPPRSEHAGACRLLDKLYVLPEFWASGAGARLHDAALDMLAAAGHTEAWLTCRAANGRAAAFYARNGWVRREYLDWDGHRWTREL